MSTPSVPPRPQRPASAKNDLPSIPPRPIRNASVSPSRESSTRSPLNGPPPSARFYKQSNRSSTESLRRPPSVAALPTLGQEGLEYSSYDELPPDAHNITVDDDPDLVAARVPPAQQNVSADIPLHQPLASLPAAAATRQVQTVTRTDSAGAAAAGIGEPVGSRATDHRRKSSTTDQLPLRTKASFNRSTSSFQPLERTTSRPGSVHSDHDHGIPEIGMQIPLYKNAGDVQAPSPAPGLSQHAPGIGFFNDGSSRNHTRKRSSRHEFGPPDSYGLRHDHERQDQFERDWVAKHPQEAAQEDYHLHIPRPATALSSEQLNRLVGLPTSEGGVGTSPRAVSTPDPDVAFEASDDYVSRLASPQASAAEASSLRKNSLQQEHDTYHLRPSSRATDKVTGGGRADNKAQIGGYDSVDEYEDAPILAADEVIKRPGSAFMQPAVNPEAYHSDDAYESDGGWSQSRRGSVQAPGRSNSRPGSTHGNSVYQGGSLHRFQSHEDVSHTGGTPLEEIEEYEPLFPEDEKADAAANLPKKSAKKRPDLASYHFPSQDTWEDTPASLQYLATVSTPEVEREQQVLDGTAPASAHTGAENTFETPQDEAKRRQQNPADMTSDSKTLLKPHFKAGALEDVHLTRPGVNRFPSSDVWEDTPDSMRLETTVSGPQMDDSRALPDERPTTSAIASQQDDGTARASTGLGGSAQPGVPSRPERKSKLAQEVTPAQLADAEQHAASVREAPATKVKPSIPARPARPQRGTDADESSAAPAVPAKAKPLVPARPGGEKIAALRAGFMSDLNNRLKLGPQAAAPPSRRAESDTAEQDSQPPRAAPLADARKSRARGPPRRKPAHTPSPPAVQKLGFSSFAMSPLITVWTIDEEDELLVSDDKPAAKDADAPLAEHHPPQQQVVEDDDDDDDDDDEEDEEDDHEEADDDDAHAAVSHSLVKEDQLSFPPASIGAEGDRPAKDIGDATTAEPALLQQKHVQPEFEKALASSGTAPAEAPGDGSAAA